MDQSSSVRSSRFGLVRLPVQFILVRFGSGSVRSGSVWSGLVLSGLVRSGLIRLAGAVWSDLVRAG